MDEGQRVLERLERIEALDRRTAAPGELLGELRALLHEAESWARSEASESPPALEAVESLREALGAPVSAA